MLLQTANLPNFLNSYFVLNGLEEHFIIVVVERREDTQVLENRENFFLSEEQIKAH